MNVPSIVDESRSITVTKTLADILIRGDLSKLNETQRLEYMLAVCDRAGIDHSTRPFEYINLGGRLVLYAKKDATDQLRMKHGVSVIDLSESEREGVFIVTAKVQNADGRTDIAKGAVDINGLKGEKLANAMMKAETKAKRRATLSICGLGMLDETEVEDASPEKGGWPRGSIMQPGDYAGGTPEKLTKPQEQKIFTRNPAWMALKKELDDMVEAGSGPVELSKWGSDIEHKIRNWPAEPKREWLKYFAKQMELAVTNTTQVVHDEDGERPATEKDFEPAPLPPEPQSSSISQRAIQARENPSADEIADYLRS